MAGRRLLDAAKLFGAGKAVAKQHLKLRSEQLDVYSRTSTLAKLAKEQTDRVTLTAQAAANLARRFDEQPRSSASYTDSASWQQNSEATVPHTTTSEKDVFQNRQYVRSEQNPVNDKEPEGLHVAQEGAKGSTLPHGSSLQQGTSLPNQEKKESAIGQTYTLESSTGLSPEQARKAQRGSESHIPEHSTNAQGISDNLAQDINSEVFYKPSASTELDYSSLPRVKVPKQSVAKESIEETRPQGVNSDLFYGSKIKPSESTAQAGKDTAQDVIPEGVNTDVFRTARVSRMLGGRFEKKSLYAEKALNRTTVDTATSEDAKESLIHEDEVRAFASNPAQDAATTPSSDQMSVEQEPSYQLRESKVPSTRFGRLWQYGGLATSMAFGAVGESFRRITGGGTDGGSLMLSPANIERLVAKLSRMRGAALKLGQMISIQDMKMLPAPIHEVLQRVQDSADYMPASQRNRVLASNLGANWESLFSTFEEVPMAAASIGQVHRAVLASNGKDVAVKVQYPGVATSIDSDLNNLSVLLTASKLLPKGLYLDKTIANARTELAWECDYIREAECQERFRKLLADDTQTYIVPTVFPEASGPQVLTAELMSGIAVTKHPSITQSQRDWIGTQILRLCLREIIEFKFMQTDPNWTNFLFNSSTQKLELLDFGASRDYPQKFVDPYVNILIGASKGDRTTVRDLSIQLGYLTGHESKTMLNAHVDSVMTLAEPFAQSSPAEYDFQDQTITDRVRALIPVMVRERLAPPPEETYSLHRKLSGAFLLCARLGSKVKCRELFDNAVEVYNKGAR